MFKILVEGKLVDAASKEDYIEWFSNIRNRRIARDYVNGYLISTVFVSGVSYIEPFETMVFENDDYNGELYRETYTDFKEAKKNHQKIVKDIKEGVLYWEKEAT